VDAAIADVKAGLAGPVPSHLRDAHYGGAAKIGAGGGYVYPHAEPGGVAEQQYPPDVVLPRTYYRPTRYGAEGRLADLWDKLRALVRGT
jgi:putative ATPase